MADKSLNTEIVVESGVAIPSIHRRARRKLALEKYPFSVTKPGQCFFVEGVDIKKMSPAVAVAKQTFNTSYTARTVERLKDRKGNLLPFDTDIENAPVGVTKVKGVMIWRDRNTVLNKRQANG